MRVITERSARHASTTTDAVLPQGIRDGSIGDDVDRRLVVLAAAAGAVLFSLSLALATRTGMWLDEAQSLAIARLPVGDLLEALRTDGSPPLYYLLLHGWTALFGTSETAARSLSAVFAAGALALVPLAGARLGGRRTAVAATVLFAVTPFVHRYATEARMYSLVVLLTVAGYLALSAALDRPARRNLVAVAAVTGLLLLTHYWAFFLLGVVAALVVVRARRAADPVPARRVLVAMALGCAAFLPWAPSFLSQLRHTGTPWGAPPGGWLFEATLRAFAGGGATVGALGFLLLGLAVLGVLARPLRGGRLELHPAGRPATRPLVAAVVGTLLAGMAVGQVSGSAFAPRYAAVVLVPFVLLAARGLAVVEHRVALPLLAAAVVGLGVVRSAAQVESPRTQARLLAATIDRRAQPGDILAFCPDQLAPAVVRLVDAGAGAGAGVTTAVYPPGSPPGRIDWVDYEARISALSGARFADSLHRSAAGSTVWLAWAPGYRSLGQSCEALFRALRALRPAGARVQAHRYDHYEHASLWRFPPSPHN